MTVTCGLFVYSECFSGGIMAAQDGLFNGRPQYTFSFNFNGNLINGRLYWSSSENVWYVEDTGAQQIMSVLPFDRSHPYGTNVEWENYTLLTYGCLSNSTSFNTIWLSDCPPTYFEFCCPAETQPERFIGLQDFEYYGYVGGIFYLESPQFSGCATVVQGSIPNGSIIYNSVTTITQFNRCIDCTGSTSPCYTQPIYTTPTPIPVLTADTGCGVNYRLVNECEPITIQPLIVECSVMNVTTIGGNDGYIELLITGGTPPYTITWSDGNSGQGIYNLTAGNFTATIFDYYKDFSATTTCRVLNPPITTPTVTPIPGPSYPDLCMEINVNSLATKPYRIQFSQSEDFNDKPTWTDTLSGYQITWETTTTPPSWSLGGLPDYVYFNVLNTNTSTPPINGWTIFGAVGTVVVFTGDCYTENICATITDICTTELIEMVIGDYINAQPAWYGYLPCNTGGDWFIYYNDINEKWETSGLTSVFGITAEGTLTGDLYTGPFGSYQTDNNYGLIVSNGTCASEGPLKMTSTGNNPVNGNDGNIIINVSGGTSPYQYSIDGGTTYQIMPIFNNLKDGIYVVVTKDANGFIIRQNLTLKPAPNKTVYQVSLNTTSRRTVNTPIITTTEYTTVITVTPSLPSGTTISFDLYHTDNYRVSPYQSASTLTIGSVLTKNLSEIPIDETIFVTSNTINTNAGCQTNNIFITATTDSWYNLTMVSGDSIVVATTVSNSRNGKYTCYLVENTETYSLSNLKITGCGNCSVENQNRLLVEVTPTPKPNVTPTVTAAP